MKSTNKQLLILTTQVVNNLRFLFPLFWGGYLLHWPIKYFFFNCSACESKNTSTGVTQANSTQTCKQIPTNTYSTQPEIPPLIPCKTCRFHTAACCWCDLSKMLELKWITEECSMPQTSTRKKAQLCVLFRKQESTIMYVPCWKPAPHLLLTTGSSILFISASSTHLFVW